VSQNFGIPNQTFLNHILIFAKFHLFPQSPPQIFPFPHMGGGGALAPWLRHWCKPSLGEYLPPSSFSRFDHTKSLDIPSIPPNPSILSLDIPFKGCRSSRSKGPQNVRVLPLKIFKIKKYLFVTLINFIQQFSFFSHL